MTHPRNQIGYEARSILNYRVVLLTFLDDEDLLSILFDFAKESNSKIFKIDFHKFNHTTVTAFRMLAESHIKYSYMARENVAKCDIFTCGDKCLPELAVEYLSEAFNNKS